MPSNFVITRVDPRQLRVCHGDFRAVCVLAEPQHVKNTLTFLGLKGSDARLQQQLRAALDHFLVLEQRSITKFGKPTTFRIWRVDQKTL